MTKERASSAAVLRVHSLFSPLTMRRMPQLHQLVDYCNDLLRIGEIADWPNALNGLQIENSGAVTRIGAAVDASTRTIDAAIERGINFLIVHHGLFWPGLQPITGGRRRMLERAFSTTLRSTAPISLSMCIRSSATTRSSPARWVLKTPSRFSSRRGNASV